MRSGPINLQESVVLREIVLARRSSSSFVARGSKPSAAVQDGPGQAEANGEEESYHEQTSPGAAHAISPTATGARLR